MHSDAAEQHMSEWSWPDDGADVAARARAAWERTVADLPLGAHVTGDVIGRRPFGVFIRLNDHPDALGLAEVTTMPAGAELPEVGQRITGLVIWHAEHNHQVRIRLDERRAGS